MFWTVVIYLQVLADSFFTHPFSVFSASFVVDSKITVSKSDKLWFGDKPDPDAKPKTGN